MNISFIFSIIKEICFFTSLIILVLLIVKVVKSFKDTKNGMGTAEEQQLNDHYRIALREMPKKLLIEIMFIFSLILFFSISNISVKQFSDFFQANKISLNCVITFLISIFFIINEIIFFKQVKNAAYYLFYDEFYEHGIYVIISTDKSKRIYNYPLIYERLDKDKRYHEYLLDRANNNYAMIKLLSPIPILSLIINIVATYFDNSNINTSLLTIIIIAMIFAYVFFAVLINKKINKLNFDLWRNDECRIKIKSLEKDFPMNSEK